MSLAPIAVFVYRRPEHTRRLLASLAANPELRESTVYVFADGAKGEADAPAVAETRRVVREVGLPRLSLFERERNAGLAASVREGVTRLCREHGRAIVLEDDLVLSPTFLEYMNTALERYADVPNVYAVAGYMYPVELRSDDDAVCLPFTSSWGWATWERAWRCFDGDATGHERLLADAALRRRFDLGRRYDFSEMLEDRLAGRNDSWAILWYLSVFLRGGLSVFPARSLVENRGFGIDGTHCVGEAPRHTRAVAHAHRVRSWPAARVDPRVLERVTRCMGWDRTLPARLMALGSSALRRLTR